MKPHMLHSQFEALEEPSNALTVDISLSVEEILQFVIKQIRDI
jgi:gluconate kinase